MDIEKIFNDLESNQMQEYEEAKKKLVELFMQKKEQWLVHNMMDYFLKTGSLRILEVLVKVQTPHDVYIFDRLSEWLKNSLYRVQALDLFCFVVRKHPTWVFKVEKHRFFKDIFKLLSTEKDIVPLMSALLCIITLLPIVPNLVPNFLSDLFDVFGHLASWNCQNPNRLSDDKLVHLQLGLQMLFHRLYGMFPWNFLSYLSEFVKRDKGGAIFHHTIKPLLETVCVHPMLVTASTDSELSNARWKEMEPHDVVVECARLSLQTSQQDFNADEDNGKASYECPDNTIGGTTTALNVSRKDQKNLRSSRSIIGNSKQTRFCSRFDCGLGSGSKDIIWSPFLEINNLGTIPLTPTPSYVLQLTGNVNSQLSLTGSSPPEAAVEATPETTPMKDSKTNSTSLSTVAIANPHAVRAILVSSQPSSPMRKDCQFNFPETATNAAAVVGNSEQQTTTARHMLSRATTTTLHDRMVQQMIQDRKSMPDDITEPRVDSKDAEYQMSALPKYKNELTESNKGSIIRYSDFSDPNPAWNCADCNETERSMCTEGGLHIPTSRSMQLLAKGIKRRNRMASYCLNEFSCRQFESNSKMPDFEAEFSKITSIRRTKSCPSISSACPKQDNQHKLSKVLKYNDRRFRNGEQQIAASVLHSIKSRAALTTMVSRLTQTVQTWPLNYESTLFEMFVENNRLRNVYDSNVMYPQEILNQYIVRTIKSKENIDAGHRIDQEHFQLLCLQLQYERYRREIHAERNRRLMGRSRDKRSLEMERDRLREQLKNFVIKNEELMQQIDQTTKLANERQVFYLAELVELKTKYQNEMEQNKCLRQANENLQTRLAEEFADLKEMNYELESLRSQIFNMSTECQQAQLQAEIGLQCKQDLAQLEAELVVMGEVQIKCRDRLAELDNYRARDEEMTMLQESYSIELKELKHLLEEKASQLDSARHKISELQAQLSNSEKVVTEQKRILKTVKDEYEEKFKALNKKYEVQKTIILQMEEKILWLHKTQAPVALTACSPDIEKTDIASSVEHNSPLSTSLASSESLSASLRSTELRNLQQFVETPLCEASCSNIVMSDRVPDFDLTTGTLSAHIAGKASNNKTNVHGFENPPKQTASSSQPQKYPHLQL